MNPGQSPALPSELDRKAVFAVSFALGLFALVGSGFLADYLLENRARQDLLAAVAQPAAVFLNGQPVSDSTVILAALRQVRPLAAHHSFPTSPIHLELKGAGKLAEVTIARDSQNADEFWVYRPGRNWLSDPLGQHAGRVVSSQLGGFLRNRGL